MTATALSAGSDNWVYLHPYGRDDCFVVDPSDAAVVVDALKKTQLRLTHIFVTHHHADHIGGLSALKTAFSCTVFSPAPDRIAGTDVCVQDGDRHVLGDWAVTVLATPGHTTRGVCYYCTGPSGSGALYSGDTLFACGCGRLFECSAETMHHSLGRLAALPDATRVYPGHDYTEENVRFALTVEPDSDALKQLLCRVRREKAFFATTLEQEKQCNPFLRCHEAAVRQATGKERPVDVFAELRRRKDRF